MKVLIFSMTCGNGHNIVAKAIKEEFETKLKDKVECKILQTYGFDPIRVEKENQRYANACTRTPHSYDFIWNFLRKRDPNKRSRIFENEVKDCHSYFKEQINSFKPDIVICTHFYASNLLCTLINKGEIDKTFITASVLTDYVVHPFWEFSKNIDYVFTPTKDVEEQLINRLFKKEQIICLGLPTLKKQNYTLSTDEAKKSLNILGTNVLIMSGGNGLGKTLKTVKYLVKSCGNKINIIIINAKNKKAKEKIDKYKNKHNLKNIVNLGFVDSFYEYISASDIVLTKGGALSLTDVMCQYKPIVVRENLIINEKINKEIFIKNGCAVGLNKTSDAGKVVKQLIDNPQKLKEMSEACKKYAVPNATSALVDFLIEKHNNQNLKPQLNS